MHAQGGESEIAVVFPGAARKGNRLGGSPARPDLHFTRDLLNAQGLAVLEVWWDFDTAPDHDLELWLDDHIDAALDAAARDHDVAVLVGRSLGTWALARAVSGDEWDHRACPTIWLAPLLNEPSVLKALHELRTPAFVVGGGRDEAFRLDEVPRLQAGGADVLVLEGAHHGLAVADPAASARLLADVLDAMGTFLARVLGGANRPKVTG